MTQKGCVICGKPASSKTAKTCGDRVCRLRLVWENNGRGREQRCAVYRCYDASGTLLYVGRSIDPEKRWADHRRSGASWVADVSRREVAWFDTVRDALCEESSAVVRERPRHNVKATQSTSFHGYDAALAYWDGYSA